jgi:hypothetical protein
MPERLCKACKVSHTETCLTNKNVMSMLSKSYC